MPVTLATEQNAQGAWKLRRQFANFAMFDELVANEFLMPDVRRSRRETGLAAILQFAATQVPHYRELFAHLNFVNGSAPQPSDLSRIPPLPDGETIRFPTWPGPVPVAYAAFPQQSSS